MLATVASGEALGALNGQGRWQDAMSKRASTHSPMIQSVVDRNRPSEGTYYRLMAEDGRLIPGRISRRPAASGISTYRPASSLGSL